MTEDEMMMMVMVRWHHQLNGHEFEQTPGDGEEKGGLVCCSPWGCKESDMTQQPTAAAQTKTVLTGQRIQNERCQCTADISSLVSEEHSNRSTL